MSLSLGVSIRSLGLGPQAFLHLPRRVVTMPSAALPNGRQRSAGRCFAGLCCVRAFQKWRLSHGGATSLRGDTCRLPTEASATQRSPMQNLFEVQFWR
eukprot:symbB.v1.2.005305.t1/scaffold283.1/size308953/6